MLGSYNDQYMKTYIFPIYNIPLLSQNLTFSNQFKEPKSKRRKKSKFSKSAFAVNATELAEEATFADIQRDQEQADEIEEIVRDSDIESESD